MSAGRSPTSTSRIPARVGRGRPGDRRRCRTRPSGGRERPVRWWSPTVRGSTHRTSSAGSVCCVSSFWPGLLDFIEWMGPPDREFEVAVVYPARTAITPLARRERGCSAGCNESCWSLDVPGCRGAFRTPRTEGATVSRPPRAARAPRSPRSGGCQGAPRRRSYGGTGTAPRRVSHRVRSAECYISAPSGNSPQGSRAPWSSRP